MEPFLNIWISATKPQSCCLFYIHHLQTAWESMSFHSLPTRTKMVSPLMILKFLTPLSLFMCIILFCTSQRSFWTLLVQTEFNSSKVLTLHNNFGLEPTAECIGNRILQKKSCVQNMFSVHYNKVALGATEVLRNEWKEKQQSQQNC